MEESNEGITKRNDRLLVVPLLLHQDRPPYDLSDMPVAELKDIEDFFVAYQAADGKDAKIIARLDKSEAERIVRESAQS
jgi:inorganic pyrophosphatase